MSVMVAAIGGDASASRSHPMTDRSGPSISPASLAAVPLGQRLFDNLFLLLGAGLLVMFVLYTGWGLWEITHLPAARLP
jgi:hypothetical protein